MALKRASTYTTGIAKPCAVSDDSQQPGHAERVAGFFFRVMTAIYGQDVMQRRYPSEEDVELGRKAAVLALGHLSLEQLRHGQNTLSKSPGQWPPPAGEFAKLCVRVPEHQIFTKKQIEHKSSKETGRKWLAQIKEKL